MPDGGVAGHHLDLSLIREEVAVESGEVVAAGRFDKEAARGGAGIDGGAVGVLSVDDETGDLTTDIVGTDFIETVAGLGTHSASSQSQ